MRSIGSFGFAVFAAAVASAATPPDSPTVSPTPLASPESITNPNTPPALGENMDFDNLRIPQFNYRIGDILIPEVKFAEPLRIEAEHFADCIRNSREPLTGIHHARTVVSILERARPLNGEVARQNSSV